MIFEILSTLADALYAVGSIGAPDNRTHVQRARAAAVMCCIVGPLALGLGFVQWFAGFRVLAVVQGGIGIALVIGGAFLLRRWRRLVRGLRPDHLAPPRNLSESAAAIPPQRGEST